MSAISFQGFYKALKLHKEVGSSDPIGHYGKTVARLFQDLARL